MKALSIFVVVITVAYVAYLFFSANRAEAPTETQIDTTFTQTLQYACADNKMIEASFGDKVAKVTLAGDSVYTLEQVSIDDENGAQYSNDGDQIVFWVKEENAFLEEDGVETYSACRAEG